MDLDELDDLFVPMTGTGGTWFEGLTDDQQAWVWRLVEKVKLHDGKMPPGKRTADMFAERFGCKPPARSTIPDTIQRLLKNG